MRSIVSSVLDQRHPEQPHSAVLSFLKTASRTVAGTSPSLSTRCSPPWRRVTHSNDMKFMTVPTAGTGTSVTGSPSSSLTRCGRPLSALPAEDRVSAISLSTLDVELLATVTWMRTREARRSVSERLTGLPDACTTD